jgi:spore germination protein KB
MFSIACFIQSSSLLSSFFLPVTQQESWLCVVLGLLLSIPLFLIYYGLMKSFPDKNLVEIFELVYGRVGGIIASLIMMWFFLSVTTYNLRDIGYLVKQTIMVDTPVLALMVVCLLVCAYGIYYGLRVVTRYAMAFSLISSLILIAGALLTLNQCDLQNFLPMFNQPPLHYVQSTNQVMTIPFGEIVFFLMIAPQVKRGKKGMLRYLIGGLLIGGLTVLIVVVRDIAVLGNTISLFTLPSFETMRMITLTQALSRMEILFTVILIVLLFFKIMLLYYVSVLALAQLLKLQSYKPLILILGAFFTVYSYVIHTSTGQHTTFSREYASILWAFFEYLMPLIALVIGRIRKLQKSGLQRGTT